MSDPTPLTPPEGAPDDDAVRQRVAELRRYAGWLGNDTNAARLRTSVQSLVRAVQNGDDPISALRTVQAHLDRLTSGGVTPLLRQTLRTLRVELGAARH